MGKRGLYRHLLPAVFSYRQRRKIGLLGGSFNPAHEGHIALSCHARRLGKFDEIWWLVSPQNPLKSASDMADYDKRLAYSRALVQPYPWMRVLDLERVTKTQFSYDIVAILLSRAPLAQFTWLMGSDNLVQFPKWYRARDMARKIPFMVMRRGTSYYPSLGAKGRHYFRNHFRQHLHQHLPKHQRKEGRQRPPHLTIGHHFQNKASATTLRESGFWH